ncbi:MULTISPECIES: DUF5916 domain-containing protein [Robiginitalea]|uniref:DUF5916 domain-containing protein n=1 Tax=Robiginitalea TaxID=252306 RepID=UPI002349583C|nr:MULTISPECIES: DUF5916 domain-containing protein [unclassified Robiginitalea]MDC6354049.1 DUF5916 domain-containing protein [Robiginitalea sp. PM2]MDC6374316.1 DUF5916 domain-containing protein [Robiginitalea sp. SP8]
MHFFRPCFIALAACLVCIPANAQEAIQPDTTNQQRPAYEAVALDEEPVVDGDVLGDPVWQAIPATEGLRQIRPNYGQPVSERTAVRVAYSRSTFYLSVVCYDSEPDKIVVSDSRRDADLNDEDSFLFIIDTYNDRQNGFLFGTNPQGMEYDAQINNEGKGNFNANRQQGGVIGGTNLNWDAAWTVRTQVGDFGWSAEFAIPFRSLRFASGSAKSWGMNFQRNIAKNTETAYWTTLPLGFDLKRLSLAGQLSGLDLVNPGNLKLIPYVLGRATRDRSMDPIETDTDFEAGADIKYSITPGLTLDLTYNTDFAQVEVDDQQVNLDRFNLFFPEKRAFFLENAGQFTVGSPGEVDLFFSRRIGLGDDGSVVPIIGGARLSGKVGNTNVGLLSMFTEDVEEAGIEENNFSVARVNHNFPGTRSSLGGIFVSRSGLGATDDDYNRVYAIDGKWGIGNKAEVNGYVAKSTTPGIESNDHAFKLLANYDWNGWNVSAGYTEVGEGFNPEVGFLQRTAFRKPELLLFKAHRFKDAGQLLEIRPHTSYRGYWDFDGNQQTGFWHIDNHWVFRSGFEVHTGINLTYEQVFQPFDIAGVTVPVGEYPNEELQLVVITNPNNAFSLSTRTFIGGYFDGKRISNSGTANYRVGDKFVSSLTFSHNDIGLSNGDVTAVVGGLRLAYSFTPRLFVQSLIQRNNVSNITSVNARLGWLQSANTGLFVVLNIVRDDDLPDALDNQVLTIKYTHQFDILK